MAKTISGKQRSKLISRRKKIVDMRPYAGKVKAFRNIKVSLIKRKYGKNDRTTDAGYQCGYL